MRSTLCILFLTLAPIARASDPLGCGTLAGSAAAGTEARLFGFPVKLDDGAGQFRCSGDNRSCLFHFAGSVGSKAGTSGTFSVPHPSERMSLAYSFRVNQEFMDARGGKLPGFCGDSTGSGPTETGGNYAGDGFSVRPMFHRDGSRICLYAYVYQIGNPNGGDQADSEQGKRKGEYFPHRGESPACFVPGSDVRVAISVGLGRPGAGQDCVGLSVDGRSVASDCRFHLRDDESVTMKRVCLHVFAGGDPSWAPSSPLAAMCMKDFRLTNATSTP